MPAPELLRFSVSLIVKVAETADDYVTDSITINQYCALSKSLRQVCVVGTFMTTMGTPWALWNVHCHLLRSETVLTKHILDRVVKVIMKHAPSPTLLTHVHLRIVMIEHL